MCIEVTHFEIEKQLAVIINSQLKLVVWYMILTCLLLKLTVPNLCVGSQSDPSDLLGLGC